MKIKICGITNHDDAQKCAYYGAWALGFVFYKKSPRYISPSKAKKIIEQLPPFVTPVGVFVNLNERAIRDICRFTSIRTVQLHGDEEPRMLARLKDYHVIKAFRVNDAFTLNGVKRYSAANGYLFDAYQDDSYGGTGKSFNWLMLKDVQFEKPVILSGGLSAENVKEALSIVKPYAVDVSSSLEVSPGRKDPQKLRAFFAALDLIPQQ